MIKMQMIGTKVPQAYTISEAFDKARLRHLNIYVMRAIFEVLTESQQVRVLEQLGWVRCPSDAIPPRPEPI